MTKPNYEKYDDEAYKELLKRRGLERHLEARTVGEKETSYQKRMEILKEILKETEGEDIVTIEDEEKLNLENEIKIITEVLSQKLTPEEIKEIELSSFSRLRSFMRERARLLKAENKIKENIEEMRKEYGQKTDERAKNVLNDMIAKFNETKEKIEGKIEQELPFKNPESFLAHFLLTIREYKKQFPSGIVETDYVKNQKEKIRNVLRVNRLAALVGETGTGKTLLARKIAEELSPQGYEFVPGHKFTTKEDLLYYYGIDVRKVKPEEIPNIIKDIKAKYKEEHQDFSEEELEKNLNDIEEVLKGQAERPEMITKMFEASVLRAAKEGKIVIIDEFNYIPPSVLGGLNALIEAKPGQKISVGGQSVEVKPGFSVILTGNITKADIQGRYLGREKVDPALVNRLNSGLIEYGSLPQAQMAFKESILTEKEFKEGKKVPKRELFQIGLTILADEKGNISGPPDLLEKIWNLSEEFSLLQEVYAGEKLETPVKLPGGQNLVLKEYAISNRTFRAVLEHWKGDNFKYSLDWYIYDNLIRPASLVSSSEAGQMFTILKERGMFFQDKSWSVLKADPPTYKIEGIEEIERNKKDFLKIQEIGKETKFFTPQEVTEAFSGVEMPKLEEIKSVKKEMIDKEKMEKYQELEEKYEKIKEFIENWKETLDLYCEDESKILGKE